MSTRLCLPTKLLNKINVNEEVTITITGKVKSLQAGLDPEEYKKRQESGGDGCCCPSWEPPSEVELDITGAKVQGKGKFELDDEDEDY